MTSRLLPRSLALSGLALGAVEFAATDRLRAALGGGDSTLIRLFGVREIVSSLAVLRLPRPTPALWVRVGGDVLDLVALTRMLPDRRGDTGRIAASLGAVGVITALDVRAALRHTGRRGGSAEDASVERTLTVGRSPDELYQLWQAPETLSRLLAGQASVSPEADGGLRWRLEVPGGKPVEWTTTVTVDQPGERVAWATAPKARVASEGEIRFRPAPGDWGTEVTLRLGTGQGRRGIGAGHPLASFVASAAIRQVLHRFKSLAETGEIPTLTGQPAARHDGRDR